MVAEASYSRSKIRRILGINENSLRSWERVGLTEAKDTYTFTDLIALKTLQSLRDNQISAKQIREALHQLRLRLANVTRPLDQLRIVSDGRRIAVVLKGQKMEALTGQMLFNFDAEAMKSAATLEFRHGDPQPGLDRADGGESWFQYALEMERSGASPQEIIAVYRKVLSSNPNAAGAWVNMGTLHYRQRLLAMAEECYQKALRAYPDYALAHFNLGNVCEETGRLDEAARCYQSALRIQPDYGDAHYNLALVEERRERFLEAIEHWKAYLRFDSSSPWSDIARRKHATLMRVNAKGDQPVGGSFRKPIRDTID